MVLIPFSKSSNRGKPPFFEKEQKPTKTQLKCSPDLCWNWLYSSQWVPATDFLKFCDRGGGVPAEPPGRGCGGWAKWVPHQRRDFPLFTALSAEEFVWTPKMGPPSLPPPWDPPGGGWVGTPPGPNLWFQRCLWPTCAPLAVGGPPPPPPCADQLYRRPPASYWP